jgi:thiol-disulfide isomerase/thioredoxin
MQDFPWLAVLLQESSNIHARRTVMPAFRPLLNPILALLLSTAAVAAPAPEAPSFTLADATGTEHTLPGEQQGIGVYLFWASWCPYCKALMPHLQSVVDEYGDRVTVYALNFRDQNDPTELIDSQGYDFVLLPDAGRVAESWGAQATPALWIVDGEGRVRFSLYDVLTENPPGYEELDHDERAARRAPFWAARIRKSIDEIAGGR